MDDYYQCYNFFKECNAFVIKHQHFLTACKRIRDNDEKLDPKMYDSFVDLFANAEKDMDSTCNEHKCIVNYFTNSDDEMESDISDIEESEDSDQNEIEDDEMDDSDTSSNDESENEVDENESDDEYDEDINEVDENEYDDDMADFFKTDKCCILELLKPFYETMIETKQFDVIRKIQLWNDEYEQKCLRFDQWFSPHEKDECALMMKEITFKYEKEGSNYFKLCESKYIKLLATYCKDVIDEKKGTNMFDQNYAKIIDSEFPLNKKRKLFTKDYIIQKLMRQIQDEATPMLNAYFEERHNNIHKKIIT